MGASPKRGSSAVIIPSKCINIGVGDIEDLRREFALLIEGIAPYEEDLVDRVESIYLKLVVGISPIDKDL